MNPRVAVMAMPPGEGGLTVGVYLVKPPSSRKHNWQEPCLDRPHRIIQPSSVCAHVQ